MISDAQAAVSGDCAPCADGIRTLGRRRRARPRGVGAASRAKPCHPRDRRRLVQRLRTGDPCAEHAFDLEWFGFSFVASPRHADVLIVTGPVTKNMREPLERTHNATPDPKWVVAVGNCAFDGGVFAGSYAVAGGVSAVIPVDPYIR